MIFHYFSLQVYHTEVINTMLDNLYVQPSTCKRTFLIFVEDIKIKIF